VDFMVRGGSSPLARTGKAPHSAAFCCSSSLLLPSGSGRKKRASVVFVARCGCCLRVVVVLVVRAGRGVVWVGWSCAGCVGEEGAGLGRDVVPGWVRAGGVLEGVGIRCGVL